MDDLLVESYIWAANSPDAPVANYSIFFYCGVVDILQRTKSKRNAWIPIVCKQCPTAHWPLSLQGEIFSSQYSYEL